MNGIQTVGIFRPKSSYGAKSPWDDILAGKIVYIENIEDITSHYFTRVMFPHQWQNRYSGDVTEMLRELLFHWSRDSQPTLYELISDFLALDQVANPEKFYESFETHDIVSTGKVNIKDIFDENQD